MTYQQNQISNYNTRNNYSTFLLIFHKIFPFSLACMSFARRFLITNKKYTLTLSMVRMPLRADSLSPTKAYTNFLHLQARVFLSSGRYSHSALPLQYLTTDSFFVQASDRPTARPVSGYQSANKSPSKSSQLDLPPMVPPSPSNSTR